MIKLKQEVNKSEIMRELKAEAEIAFENAWQKEMQIGAYMNGAHDLFKKLRIAHVSGELPPTRQEVEKLLLDVWSMGMDAQEVGLPSFDMAKTGGRLKEVIDIIVGGNFR